MSGEIYYICFNEAERPKFWMRFLKKGFSHCFVLQPHKGKWIKYEAGHGVVRVDILDNVDSIINECIICKHERGQTSSYFSLMSCVGFAKATAGIKGLALTPYQLYKRLKRWALI